LTPSSALASENGKVVEKLKEFATPVLRSLARREVHATVEGRNGLAPLSGRPAEAGVTAHWAADQSVGAREKFRKRSSNDSSNTLRHQQVQNPAGKFSVFSCEKCKT
jgi:hypothetical protein